VRGDTASSAATAFASACAGAAVAALVSTGGARLVCVTPNTSAAAHAPTSARDGTTIRVIDVAVIIRDRWPDRWLVSTPGLILRRFVLVFKSA
jgi:hypothetical protein